MKSQWLKNMLIISPAVAGMSIAGYYLYEDYTTVDQSRQETVQREIIAEVTFTSNNVKRKLGDGVLWEPLDKKTQLYVKDSIRTGGDSYATIKFTDGNLVEVNENSLIVLDKTTDKLSIDFKVGDITSKGEAKGLEIKVNDSVLLGDHAELKLKSGPGNKTDIVLNKGKATLSNKTQKSSINLDQNQKALLNEKGQAAVSQVAVILKSPNDRQIVRSSAPEIKTSFLWDVLKPEITQERLEISRNEKFPENGTKTYQAHKSITVPLLPGLHYWRIAWPSGKLFDHTESRRIAIEADRRIELTFPENESSFEPQPGENVLDFAWTNQVKGSKSQLEISQQLDFQKLMTKQVLTTLTYRQDQLIDGVYYWRVRAIDEKSAVITESAVHTFKVKLKLPSLPNLLMPVAQGVWEKTSPVHFTWQSVPGAATYRLQISNDQTQKGIQKTENTKSTLFYWKWSHAGTYYWSVIPQDKNGAPLGASEIRKFEIAPKNMGAGIILLNPKDRSEIIREKVEKPEPVIFQWKPLRKMPGPYTIIIGKNPDLKDAQKKEGLTLTSFPLRLNTSGTYYWKVVSSSTLSSKTTVPQATELPPKVSTPSPGQPTKAVSSPEAVTKPMVSPASGDSPSTPTPVSTPESLSSPEPSPVKVSTLLFHGPVPPGSRKVVAVNAQSPGQSTETRDQEFSEVAQFEYKINTNLPSPALMEPLNKAAIVEVEPQPVKFVWAQIEGAAQYRLLVEKYDPQTQEKVPVVDKLEKKNTSISMPLQEGEYLWSVASVDSQGQAGLQSKPRTFSITFQEELAAPQLKAPVVK